MSLSDYIVNENSTILQAMEIINNNSKGIVYVVADMILKGAITDGDIRRFLLQQGDLSNNVMNVANKNPLSLVAGNEKFAKDLMIKEEIRSIPILDEQGKIVKICFSDENIEDMKEKLDIPVVIMAGGKGTRLYPYTKILPKPLMPIGDKTITEHIMNHFINYGCNQFIMIVNYMKHFIKSYFDENKMNINYVDEMEFLGTGGGLRLLDKKINSTFFMTNCDILIEEDYSKILKYHREHNNMITMVCAVKHMIIPYGIVEMSNEEILELKEKPEFSFITNTGFYVIEPEFIDMIPENTFIHITDIIQKCIMMKKKVGVYKINEDNWLDMGQLDELEKMKEKMNVK